MTHKENIMAILECYFAGFKEEIIDSACSRILEQESCEDAISRQAVLEILNTQRFGIQKISWGIISEALLDLPLVTPKHTDAEIQKMQELEQAEIQKAYELGKEDKIKVLDKIRDEIEEYKSRQLTVSIGIEDLERGKQIALECVLAIIDRYMTESEDKEWQQRLN